MQHDEHDLVGDRVLTDNLSKEERDALKELDDAIAQFGEPDAATMASIDQMHAAALEGPPAPSMFRPEKADDTAARIDAAQGIADEGGASQPKPGGESLEDKIDRIGDILERILSIMES